MYTNKQWRGCWKGTNANSITTTISTNINLQQSIRIQKKLNVSKDKKRPFTLTIRRDLIFLKPEVWFFTKVTWPSFVLPRTLVWFSEFLIRTHATTLAALLKRNFPYEKFSSKLPRSRSSQLLWVASCEKLCCKASLSKVNKESNDTCRYQLNSYSENSETALRRWAVLKIS